MGLSRAQRRRVAAEQAWLCRACAVSLECLEYDIDHIVPRSRGGSDERTNLQALCVQCHAAKSRSEQRARRRADSVADADCAVPMDIP